MTPQSSVNFPKTHLKTAQNGEKHYEKRVLRAVFALRPVGTNRHERDHDVAQVAHDIDKSQLRDDISGVNEHDFRVRLHGLHQ